MHIHTKAAIGVIIAKKDKEGKLAAAGVHFGIRFGKVTKWVMMWFPEGMREQGVAKYEKAKEEGMMAYLNGFLFIDNQEETENYFVKEDWVFINNEKDENDEPTEVVLVANQKTAKI